MRIHSSSLTSIPAGYNRKVAEGNSVQKDRNDLSSAKDTYYNRNGQLTLSGSSLTYAQTSAVQKVAGVNNTQNRDQHDLSVAKYGQYPKNDSAASYVGIIRPQDNVNPVTQDSSNKLNDLRTLRAISAYTQEINASQQYRRTSLITGIDAYA